jgi:hypothetical protein
MVPRMRYLTAIFFLAALSACASSPASAPAPTVTTAPPVAPATTPPATSHAAQLLALAGRANAPTRADIEHAFGGADIARQDGASVALTYRLNTCALFLVFTADGHNAMRLAEAHPSARQAGAAAPTLDQCATEADARHA